jgi:LDH2 family malate/lactate/ureidoglycolate dehydrogenase
MTEWKDHMLKRLMLAQLISDDNFFISHPVSAGMLQKYGSRDVEAFVTTLLKCYNISNLDALTTSRVLVEADLRGISSHGINTLDNVLLRQIENKVIDPHAKYEIIKPSKYGSIVAIDAKGGLGHPISKIASRIAIENAKIHGMGYVSVFNSTHFGAASMYAEKIAKNDCMGIVTCTTGVAMIPHGANAKVLGTNPICWSLPYQLQDKKSVVTIDMATTPRASNHIFKALLDKEKVLPFSVYTADGELTRNPLRFGSVEEFMSNGAMAPLGASDGVGYKGSGLGFLIELATNLAGGPTARINQLAKGNDRRVRQTFLAVAIDAFKDAEQVRLDIGATIANMRKAGGPNMLLPGELEFLTRKKYEREGIPYDSALVARLNEYAKKVQITELRPIQYSK